MEAGTKSIADGEIQRGSQAFLWQLKKFHMPKKQTQQIILKQKQRKEKKFRIAQRLIRRGFF
jgi:hypothetical protein